MTTENGEQKKIAVPSGPEQSRALRSDPRMVAGPKDRPTINLRDYLSLFFKHKKIILISFITILILSSLYPLFIYEAKFRARSVLLVKFGWENLTPDLMPEGRRLPSVNQGEIIQSEVSILKSRELKERAVNALKPENIFPELASKPVADLTSSEAAIYLIEKDLTVTPERGNSIVVSLAGDNPERASAIVNQLVDSYIERRGEIYRDPKSVLFLEKKADEYAQKLSDAESRLKAFRDETNLISFDEQKTILVKQQYDLRHARSNAESEKKANLEKISELEKQLNTLPRMAQTDENALSYRLRWTEQKILDLQLLERELAAKYKEGNKLLTGARERLSIATDFMENQRKIKPAEVVDPAWQDLQKQHFAAKAQVISLDAQIAAIDLRIRNLEANTQNFEALEQKSKALTREVTESSEKYQNYRQKVEEAKIFDELNRQKMTSISVVERASPSNVPTNPFKSLFIFIPIILAVAVVGSLGIAYIVEILGHGLSTPTDAEKRLELPVLVSIAVK